VQNTRENFQLEVYSANIVFACESVLRIITELKHSILVNDFETMNELVERQTTKYRAQIGTRHYTLIAGTHAHSHTDTVEPQIRKLNHEINEALYELETSYYSSSYRHTSSNSTLTSSNASNGGVASGMSSSLNTPQLLTESSDAMSTHSQEFDSMVT
jgi:hypothetical protein